MLHWFRPAIRLSAGDAAFAPSGIVHSIRNPGPERLVVMAVLGPPPPKY
jgi:mannose-6-phosphate isomerase-like protein (cupin superfamily)